MKSSVLLRLKEFCVPRFIAPLLLVSLGLTSGVFGQVSEDAELWREWMSIWYQSEFLDESLPSGPRIYLMTDRVIEQTGPASAQFQNGRYRMVLADGSVPDVDGDVDYYTDGFELESFTNMDDPVSIPRDGDGNPLPTDAFPVLLADGTVLGIADATLDTDTKATIVAPFSGGNVRVIAAPASSLKRPVSFTDYSSQFYYYYQYQSGAIGTYLHYPLSLYHLKQEYLNPQDCSALERAIVPGVYYVEFPTIQNAPYGKSTFSVAHRLLPNGSLTQGLQQPTWLIRSLKSQVKFSSPPVEQSWVNGRLAFDPYLPMTLTWDSLYNSGLATSSDYIDISIEEDDLGDQISYSFRVNATTSEFTIDNSSMMNLYYGTIKSHLGKNTGLNPYPLSVSAHIVMKYSRYANGQSSADLSTVTVRVPVQMTVSFDSWRKAWFPTDAINDAVSGPNADPDQDGYTNNQEFLRGSNPAVADVAITNLSSSNITTTTATISATVAIDPAMEMLFPGFVLESGFVYAPTATNPYPELEGTDVTKVVSGTLSENLTGLMEATQYSYQAYVTTLLGTYYSSPVGTFTTLPIELPTLSAPTSTLITETTATLGSSVTNDGGALIEDSGFVYALTSINSNPQIGDSGVTQIQVVPDLAGVLTLLLTDLQPGQSYSFNAYATNSAGTTYSTPVGTFTTLITSITLPTLSIPTNPSMTTTTTTMRSTVLNTGGAAILNSGFVYALTSINPNPKIGDYGAIVTLVAPVAGVLSSPVTGLQQGKSYSCNAYASNSVGTNYSTPVVTFTTYTLPTVMASAPTNLAPTTVTFNGNVTSNGGPVLNARGVVYSSTNTAPALLGANVITLPSPGTATGAYSANATGLTAGTLYYYRAYATNSVGTSYGTPTATFTTPSTVPTVTTPTSASVTNTTATLGGKVTATGGTPITERGVVYSSILPDPVIGLADQVLAAVVVDPLPFTAPVTLLTPGTLYYYRAYAKNSLGTSYSPSSSFTTSTAPTVTSPASAGITAVGASMSGNVTSNGGSVLTGRGVVYSVTSVNPNPLIGGAMVTQRTVAGTTIGVFWVDSVILDPNTSYSYKAYAINAFGTTYSSVATFTTALVPTVANMPATDITAFSATLGGNVTNGGNPTITERGFVCSSTTVNADPRIGGVGVTQILSTGTTGVFTAPISGLMPSTSYTFRPYAINSGGTSYSTTATFSTRILPTLTTPTIANLAGTSVTLGGNLTGAGDGAVTERGVVFSRSTLNSDPQIGGTDVTKVVGTGTTIGVFTVNATGLLANTGYSFKAYATSSYGTGYSSIAIFSTPVIATVTAPTVTTPTIAAISNTSATLGANVTSNGGDPITERGIIYSLTATNSNPFIGGAGVVKTSTIGTVGVFTLNITGLAATSSYTFKAYAINGIGISYSTPNAFFTTLTAPSPTTAAPILLGLSHIQWLPASTPNASSMLAQQALSSSPALTTTPSETVPQFAYTKTAEETQDGRTYVIEVSTDVKNWQNASALPNEWLVDLESQTITVQWISTSRPPARTFFRVKAQ